MRLHAVALAALLPGAAALDNGRALTPPAGWTAWNVYVFHPTQPLIEASMRALAQPRGPQNRSLVDLGYVQANLDDAWQACGAGVNRSFHDAAGNPLWNERAFPNVSAMTELGASLGIEPGLYMNNCQCSENMFTDPAQIAAIVRRSAAAVARLGFLSLKLDSCGQFNNVTLWADELNATGVAIAIENCHQGGMAPGQDRVPGQAHCSGTTPVSDCPYSSYRTSDDIQPTWAHLINNINSLVAFLGDERQGDPPPRSRPGGWAYPDALQTGSLGVLSWSGYTPRPDGWVPAPLVEDRSDFGLHCITSSPLILSLNLTNDTLLESVWPIIANEEALEINRQWAGSPGRLVATIRPTSAEEAAYVLRKGQIGWVSGWGHTPQSARGLTCPNDEDQMPGAAPSCNLLRVAALTIAESRGWCSANASCAAFSYKDADGNSSAVRTVYFKGATQLAFMDSNFHAGGQVQSGWLTQIKRAVAPPGSWRGAPCAGTVCPAGSPPCHEACRSIAPCCSAHGPAGESLEFSDGEAQLWSKRLVDGSLALLLVNLGQATATHSFTLEEVGLRLNRSTAAVAVRDIWERADRAPIAKDGRVIFANVAGHDSRFVVLTPLERSDAGPSPPSLGGPAVNCLPHARQGAAAVSWNNSVLLVGGSTSPGKCLPPYTEWATVFIGTRQGGGALAWREYTRLSSGLTHAEAVTIGDTLYVMGGYGPGPCEHSPSKGKCAHSSVWALDLARPELPAQPRAPMAYNRSNFGVSVHGGKVYTAGGYGNYGLLGSSNGPECVQSDVDVYDPATDKWSSLQPMTTKRGGFSLGSVGGLLFAVAGFHCTNGPAHTESLSSVEAYDIAANKWMPVSPLPGQPNALYVLVPVDNASFLVVGGFNGTSGGDMQPEDLLRPIWKMEVDSSNPSSNSWSRVSELPNSRGFPAAALAGEQLFVIGGYDSSSKNDSALVQALDMETLSWSNCSSAKLHLNPEQSEPAPLSQEVAVKPGDDLAALARAHPPDTTFLLQPGIYRMQEVIPKDGQRFVGVGQSAAEVIVTGAALIPRSRVTRDAATGLYVARGIKATGTFHGPCAPGFPRCNYTQDLFLGDEPLLHVASRAALLDGPGQRWYFDFNSSAVWLAADPGSDALELGTSRAFLFGGNANRVLVANLTVTKYGSHL